MGCASSHDGSDEDEAAKKGFVASVTPGAHGASSPAHLGADTAATSRESEYQVAMDKRFRPFIREVTAIELFNDTHVACVEQGEVLPRLFFLGGTACATKLVLIVPRGPAPHAVPIHAMKSFRTSSSGTRPDCLVTADESGRACIWKQLCDEGHPEIVAPVSHLSWATSLVVTPLLSAATPPAKDMPDNTDVLPFEGSASAGQQGNPEAVDSHRAYPATPLLPSAPTSGLQPIQSPGCGAGSTNPTSPTSPISPVSPLGSSGDSPDMGFTSWGKSKEQRKQPPRPAVCLAVSRCVSNGAGECLVMAVGGVPRSPGVLCVSAVPTQRLRASDNPVAPAECPAVFQRVHSPHAAGVAVTAVIFLGGCTSHATAAMVGKVSAWDDFSLTGRAASGGADGSVLIWEVSEGVPLHTLSPRYGSCVVSLAASTGELAVAESRGLTVWSGFASESAPQHRLSLSQGDMGTHSTLRSVQFASEGYVVIALRKPIVIACELGKSCRQHRVPSALSSFSSSLRRCGEGDTRLLVGTVDGTVAQVPTFDLLRSRALAAG